MKKNPLTLMSRFKSANGATRGTWHDLGEETDIVFAFSVSSNGTLRFAPKYVAQQPSWARCSLCVFSSRNLSIYLSML